MIINVLGVTVAAICVPGYLVHLIGDRVVCRARREMPIVTPAELRMWQAGAVVGTVFVAYILLTHF